MEFYCKQIIQAFGTSSTVFVICYRKSPPPNLVSKNNENDYKQIKKLRQSELSHQQM